MSTTIITIIIGEHHSIMHIIGVYFSRQLFRGDFVRPSGAHQANFSVRQTGNRYCRFVSGVCTSSMNVEVTNYCAAIMFTTMFEI